MNYISTLTNQIIQMFIVIAIGLILKRIKFYSDEFIKDLGNLLFNVINPLTIFNSFVNQYSSERVKELILSFCLVTIAYAVCFVLINIIFKKENGIEKFGCIIGNPGFFGLPIVISVFDQSAVFYAVATITINSILQWTYGAYLMTRDKKEVSLKKIITNTSVISFVLGLLFFFARIPFPSIFSSTINALSSMMGPICALIVGSNLAGTDLKKLKDDLLGIVTILLRLIVVPLLFVFLLKFVDEKYFVLKFTLLITMCTPSGSSTTVFARMFNQDYEKAARLVCVCTLLCGITMPLITSLAIKLW